MIQVRHVTERFDAFAAVTNLSFDADNRAITGLLGANGAGKTTRLRMIAGVLRPDGGAIHVGGESPQGNAVVVQERLGALLDHTGLYPRLTARENIEYFAELRGMPRATRGERIGNILTVSGWRSSGWCWLQP